METVVEVRNISKTFVLGSSTIEALRNVSLGLGAGELVVLSGPSDVVRYNPVPQCSCTTVLSQT